MRDPEQMPKYASVQGQVINGTTESQEKNYYDSLNKTDLQMTANPYDNYLKQVSDGENLEVLA